MGLKLTFTYVQGAFENAMFSAFHRPIADSVQDAVFEAGQQLQDTGRANIAAAGFGKKWQNGLRLLKFPRIGKKTIDAAAFVFHKFIYAHIFETGGTIPGKPFLWLPTRNAPAKIGSKRFTPRNVEAAGIKLFSFGNSRTPLLGAKVQGKLRAGKTSLASIKRGATAGAEGTTTAPLFFGIPTARIRDRFQIAELAAVERTKLPSLYFKHLKKAD